MRPERMPSVISNNRFATMNQSPTLKNRLNGNLDKLSQRQDRPLRNCFHSNIVKMDGVELP